MTHRVDLTRNDALHMEVVPWDEADKHDVYTLISQGWHPYDVAKAYGFLVKGRQLARILDSPMWEPRPERKMFTYKPLPNRHRQSGQYFYSQQDREDAVWLVEHGWHIKDVAVMLGMGLHQFPNGCITTDLYHYITSWSEEVHGLA